MDRSTVERYVGAMREKVYAKLDIIHTGVSNITVVDFPDHNNVGDNAIYLGELAYWRDRGHEIDAVYSQHGYNPALDTGMSTLAIHGGGNFGGLYPTHSDFRYALSQSARSKRTIIQMPQSVEFVDDTDRMRFCETLGARPATRIGVRDETSLKDLGGQTAEVTLVPDAFHAAGFIDSEEPTTDVVYLLREDKESALDEGYGQGVDWTRLGLLERAGQRLRRQGIGPLPASRFNRMPEAWAAQADRRFRGGVNLLAPGEVVVTDRLHAMLIALQMGRRVIAVDNNVHKLSRYIDTWFADLTVPLELVDSMAEATRLARRNRV
ncbi:polysaccharide pyruvyl transferase family protein [Arthrobacter sp. PAMC 25486]|uniref:polysaccharide pyruvyl transferase family protein n=1 Tax=Arthrobacter sp. PAMC 25486 TaxID=1494608 RepID=UPI0005708514|nr:polysaccharide pyruvyl transferase family protein [Arthrobacter sp. PAMC 25486]